MVNQSTASLLPSYKALAEYTGTCIPTLRGLVNRPHDPLPAVRVSPRKYVFVADQVDAWFRAEAVRQSGYELD